MFYIPPPLSHAGDCRAATPLAMTFTHIPVIARRAKPDEAIPCNRKAQLLYPPPCPRLPRGYAARNDGIPEIN